jgi:hypothetical protein
MPSINALLAARSPSGPPRARVQVRVRFLQNRAFRDGGFLQKHAFLHFCCLAKASLFAENQTR